jgi:hypothetical protein
MKKYLLGSCIVVLLIGFSAFITSDKAKKVPDTVYSNWYTIEDNVVTGVFDHNKSQSQIVGSAPCPDDGEVVCL